MSLQKSLSALKARFDAGHPPFDGIPLAARATMSAAVRDLIDAGAADRVLREGPAPGFELADADGAVIRLGDLLKKGPVVLSFYRGAWCAFCNLDLAALEAASADIRATGATLVAITPQTAANSRKSIAQHGLTFPVLSDPGNRVAEAYGLRSALPQDLIAVFRQLGVDLPLINGEDSWTLPSPGRFAIDRQGQIRYAEADPDYTRRPEPQDLLPVLRGLTPAPAP